MVCLWIITIALSAIAVAALIMVVGSAMRSPQDPGAGAGFELDYPQTKRRNDND